MALLGIHCGKYSQFICNPITDLRPNRLNQISQFNPSLSISNPIIRKPPQRISASSTTLSNPPISSPHYSNTQPHNKIITEESHREPVFSEKLDEWMRESVVEIVKNIKQAPLLVHIYANNNGSVKVKTEKGIAEDWPNLKREWRNEERQVPDGIIFVEEIEGKEELGLEENGEEDEMRAWGAVIQGKGVEMECGSPPPVCYLLKTSRVEAGLGLGLGCTHFCLVRVKSFRESALSQLTDCWLLQ